MKNDIQIRNSADVCYIDIEGTIGVPEEWQFESPDDRVATYGKFRDTVARIAALDSPRVVVNIRSTGGDVNDALLIYEALAALDAEVTTRCYGYAASAATLIAQAAGVGRREISAGALYLVHASACAAEGNAAELEARAELLRKTDQRLAALYALRSGHTQEEFATLMAENNGHGRWLSPEETVEAGLADRIVDTASAAADEKRTDRPATGNLAHGWNRLLAAIGLYGSSKKEKTAPAGAAPHDDRRNILHFDGADADPTAGRAAAEAVEGQRRIEATQVLPCEDPSAGEIRRSANERAYAADARRLAAK